MSVASSTPGHSDRYCAPPPPTLPVPAAASGAALSTSTAAGPGKDGSGRRMKTRRSGGTGRAGGEGWAGSAMPPPAPRGETKSEWNRGVAEKEAEEEGGDGVGVDSGDDGCLRTPEGPSMSGGSEGLLGSGVKRKRDRDADRRAEEEAAEAEKERVLAELAAERTRCVFVCMFLCVWRHGSYCGLGVIRQRYSIEWSLWCCTADSLWWSLVLSNTRYRVQ